MSGPPRSWHGDQTRQSRCHGREAFLAPGRGTVTELTDLTSDLPARRVGPMGPTQGSMGQIVTTGAEGGRPESLPLRAPGSNDEICVREQQKHKRPVRIDCVWSDMKLAWRPS